MASDYSEEPSFIERDPAKVTAELIELYEGLTGKTLQPAQPERLFIDVIAYRESLLRIQIQAAAVKNLVRFSSGDMLDYLGELVQCGRLPARAAATVLRFTLTGAQGFDVVIPAGTQRLSKDGKVIFETVASLTIPAGDLFGDVAASAASTGTTGNGYLAGEVNGELEPIAHLSSAVNTTTTAGGAEVESDDHYKARLMEAPEGYSVAGPRGAYRYFAMSAHQDIVDAAVTTPVGGTVNVYPITVAGAPSQAILDAVAEILSDEDIRPLNDKVMVMAPTRVPFSVVANVTLQAACTVTDLEAKADIEQMLADYTAALRGKLGADLVQDQFKAVIMRHAGVYSCPLAGFADRVLSLSEWADCTGITVNIVGRVNG